MTSLKTRDGRAAIRDDRMLDVLVDVVGWHERRGNMHGTSLKTHDGRAAIRDEYRMCLRTWALGMKAWLGTCMKRP